MSLEVTTKVKNDLLRLALIQMKVSADKEENLKAAEDKIKMAAAAGAKIVALPEMFSCPYSNACFRDYAEGEDGETVKRLSAIARAQKIYLVGGTIPELDGDRVYNTSFIFGKNGELIGKHRKVHLFDIDIEGGISFRESDTLTAGEEITVVETEFCKVGVAICYDVRFPEMMRIMALRGAKLIILPAAFNMTTGPVHWDLTMRARALDNQVYFAAVSPARDMEGPYQAYGNSLIVNPWGDFVAHTDESEGIIFGNIDLKKLEKIRNELPLLKHRREEIYKL